MQDFVRKDLFDRVEAGQHAEATRSAMADCFTLADHAAHERRSIYADLSISGNERQKRLTEFESGPLASRLDAITQPFQAIRSKIEEARTTRHAHAPLPAEDVKALSDLALVDAARYFVTRELRGR